MQCTELCTFFGNILKVAPDERERGNITYDKKSCQSLFAEMHPCSVIKMQLSYAFPSVADISNDMLFYCQIGGISNNRLYTVSDISNTDINEYFQMTATLCIF